MRIGVNPEQNKEVASSAYHRIIVPVYVPHFREYFEHGMEFTRLCLESLIKTSHDEAVISVVNNGSCKEIKKCLQELHDSGKIDQLIHQAQNIGKIDAMMQVARTSSEPLITLTDGDVLFLDGWMQAVEEVFVAFPRAGMVSPVPHGNMHAQYTVNTLYDGFRKGLLKFQSQCDPEDMLRFAESIGRADSMYKDELHLKNQLTVTRKGMSAVVGCGHFVATMRREVFDHTPEGRSGMAYASSADRDYIDLPNEKAGFWRLATIGNYAYHLGNQPQDWMYEKFERLKGDQKSTSVIPMAERSRLSYGMKKRLLKLWWNRWTRPYWYKRMGLKVGSREF